jgi:general secretion pathway protein D
MNNWIQAMRARSRWRPPPRRLAALTLPLLLALGALLLWSPPAHGATQLVLNPIPINPTNVAVGSTLNLQITYANTDIIPPDAVIFFLTNAPVGATISASGAFSWTPTTSQVTSPLGTNITVFGYEQLQPANFASITFRVIVTNPVAPVNPPVLAPIANQTVNAGSLLQFNVYATNTDGSTSGTVFELTSTTSALITNVTSRSNVFTGQFRWTPTTDDAGENSMTVTAVEHDTNSSAPRSFTVTVNLNEDCPQSADFFAAVEQGGVAILSDCSTLVLTNVINVTRDVTILGETNVTITANSLSRLFTVRAGGSLTLSNITLLAGLSTGGGAVYVEKGGTFSATDCTFRRNIAAGLSGLSGTAGSANNVNYGGSGGPALSGWPGLGGAICSQGHVELLSCQFQTNTAVGGSGGNGGNGAGGSYQGGNGGQAGNGAAGYGGAIYSVGTLAISSCAFSGNVALGGDGGDGGAAGGGAFNGYAGSGGFGGNAGGGAILTGSGIVMEACDFSFNLSQGGNSKKGGTAGGGYGVNGAPGGGSYGGAVCLMGAGVVARARFSTNAAIGGNGGDGGDGFYGGGNGGNAGEGVGGCLMKFGSASVVNCSFLTCEGIPGTNGAAGGGPFPGRPGLIGHVINNRLTNSFNGPFNAFGVGSPVLATAAPNAAYPTLIDPSNPAPADKVAVGATSSSAAAEPETSPSLAADAAAAAKPASGSSPGGAGAAPSATTPPTVGGAPAALPSTPAGTPAAAAAAPKPSGPGQTNAPPAAPGATNAPGEEPLPEGMIDFRGADLNQVLDIYSMLVNRTLLRPATLPAPTIVLKTQGHLTMKEGIQALEAVLALNGITMVPAGDKFVKVVAEPQAGSAAAPISTNTAGQLPELGQYVTHVVQLKYAKPSELVPVLTPFLKIPNAILPLDANQIIVLRDYAENVKRMLEMVERIDVAVPSEFIQEVIPIKYARASEIAGALNSLSSGGGGATVGGSTGGSGGGMTTGTSRTSGSRMGGTRSGSMGGGYGSGGYGGYQGGMGGGFGQPGFNPQAGMQQQQGTGSSFTQRLQNIVNRASNVTGDIQVIGQTKIISDERTNSLLIFASREDMKVIKDIVAKLDIVLAQVLIESAIISVSLSDSQDFGFSYLQHPQNIGNWTGVGALNNKTFASPGDYLLNASGITNSSSGGGVIPGGFSYLMSFGQDLDVAVKAASADARAKILQRPRIQTSHNEPASLFVGESRPYPTSSYYGGGAYGGYSSIQQLQIGVSLDVTPLINPDGLVVLDIHQKIDAFEGNVTIANVGDVPITSEKEAQAKVSVRDHDTIILGGLIETDKNKSKSGVPFLMDIPMLGYLFRSSHTDEARRELIVLIRPTVLPTPEIAALTATAEKNKMPGVRATEKELREEEVKRLKQSGWGEPIPFEPVKPK